MIGLVGLARSGSRLGILEAFLALLNNPLLAPKDGFGMGIESDKGKKV